MIVWFSEDDPVMVMCLVRASKDATITGPCAGDDLTALRERPFRPGRTFVNRAFFRCHDRFHAAVRKTLSADGARNGLKQRIEFVVQSHTEN